MHAQAETPSAPIGLSSIRRAAGLAGRGPSAWTRQPRVFACYRPALSPLRSAHLVRPIRAGGPSADRRRPPFLSGPHCGCGPTLQLLTHGTQPSASCHPSSSRGRGGVCKSSANFLLRPIRIGFESLPFLSWRHTRAINTIPPLLSASFEPHRSHRRCLGCPEP